MGYQAEKNKIEGKLRIIKIVVLCVLLAVLLGLCIFSAFVPPETWKYHVSLPKMVKREEGALRIHFIDVGQGDSILLELPDGKVALIDGGDGRESTETKVLRYLNALKIDTIDYLIVSHADADHCGSLDKVVRYKTVLNAYLPTTSPENTGAEYAELYALLMEEEDCVKHYSARGIPLADEDAPYVFTFLHPYTVTESDPQKEADDNTGSAVIWLDYHGVSALLTGDAPMEVESALMRDDNELGLFSNLGVDLKSTEILKVAHHGSADSTSLEFLRYLNAETAVISCGKNNLYGHPSQEVQTNLQIAGVSSYRTDEIGSIVISVADDGKYTMYAVN